MFADPAYASNVVTVAKVPEGLTASEIRNALRINYNTVVAGGQGVLKESIIRIGHLGFFTEEELTTTLTQLGAVLRRLARAD